MLGPVRFCVASPGQPLFRWSSGRTQIPFKAGYGVDQLEAILR